MTDDETDKDAHEPLPHIEAQVVGLPMSDDVKVLFGNPGGVSLRPNGTIEVRTKEGHKLLYTPSLIVEVEVKNPTTENKTKHAISGLDDMAEIAHSESRKNGWYESEKNESEMIALMHSELSEALEVLRKPNPDGSFVESEKIPGFNAMEEEIADLLIRVGDFAAYLNLRLDEAVAAKIEFNGTRGHKYGGKKF